MQKDGYLGLERRRFFRLKDMVFVNVRLGVNTHREFRVFAKDISAGGLMFESERNVSRENELHLEIYQPVYRDQRIIFSIPVLAKVIWTRKIQKNNFADGENKYKIGVRFMQIEAEDRQRIVDYIGK